MATVYDRFKAKGMRYCSNIDLQMTGELVIREWHKRAEGNPKKIKQKEGWIFKVNAYPDWFVPVIDKCIDEYLTFKHETEEEELNKKKVRQAWETTRKSTVFSEVVTRGAAAHAHSR